MFELVANLHWKRNRSVPSRVNLRFLETGKNHETNSTQLKPNTIITWFPFPEKNQDKIRIKVFLVVLVYSRLMDWKGFIFLIT